MYSLAESSPLYTEISGPPQEIGSTEMTQGGLGSAVEVAACGNGKDHSPLQQRPAQLKGHFGPTAFQPVQQEQRTYPQN